MDGWVFDQCLVNVTLEIRNLFPSFAYFLFKNFFQSRKLIS